MTSEKSASRRYRAGDLIVDQAQHRVWRGSEVIELSKLSFQTLLVLIDSAPNLVEHEQLITRVWGPRRIVTPENVAKRVMLLRKALGDDADQPRYIEGVRALGYRFIPSVTVQGAPDEVSARQRVAGTSQRHGARAARKTVGRAALAFAAVAVMVAVLLSRQPSSNSGSQLATIAVLPFENGGSNPNDAYLGGAFSDELRDQIGRVARLQVAARSSSLAAQLESTDAHTRSELLGVAYLVEGQLRRDGERLYVSVQVVEGSTGLMRWNEVFDVNFDELLSVQQTVAEEITAAVLPGTEIPVGVPTTRVPSANELMLLAGYYEREVREDEEVDEETIRRAVDLYRRATIADPDSALAFSRLAGALLYLGDYSAAEAPIFRALTLNPELSEVQNVLGRYHWATRAPQAGPALERAHELNPNNADAMADLAYWYWMIGRFPEAEPLYRRALELDRLSLSRYAAFGEYLGMTGQAEKAVAVAGDIEQMFRSPAAYSAIARLHELAGNLDLAMGWVYRAQALDPSAEMLDWQLAELYAQIGDTETALTLDPDPGVGVLFLSRSYAQLIDKAEALIFEEPDDLQLRYLLGFAYAATGDYSAAIGVLESTGLPDSMFPAARQSEDFEALVTLISALRAVDDPQAERLATAHLDYSISLGGAPDRWEGNPDWWNKILNGCSLAVLGRVDEALQSLEATVNADRLPWDPLLKDLPCFGALQEESRFVAVVDHFDARRAELRERLPTTLARFGVRR